MRHTLYFILSFILSACAGDVGFNSWSPIINKDFEPYVNEFEYLSDLEINYMRVEYGAMEAPNEAARCYSSGSKRAVIINKTKWVNLCDWQKRAVIFHELGHCVFGRQHIDTILSFMYPSVLPCDFYERNNQALIDEMFN